MNGTYTNWWPTAPSLVKETITVKEELNGEGKVVSRETTTVKEYEQKTVQYASQPYIWYGNDIDTYKYHLKN